MASESKGKAGESVSCSTCGVSTLPNGHLGVEVPDLDSGAEDEDVESKTQIKNLLWIETSPWHKKAQEFWSTRDALCTRRVDSKRKQSQAVKNEVYQLIGFYSVFQGVLLTAVSQSNLLHCNNWWSAFFLSGLASAVAFLGIIQKFRTVWSLELTIESEKESRQIFVTRGQKLLRKGEDFKFHVDAKDGDTLKRTSRLRGFWEITKKRLGSIVACLVLVLFSVTFLVSIQRILCNPGRSKLPGA